MTEMIYLVRHAKAGSREEWRGDDRKRPLSKSGRRQATAIAEQLIAVTPTCLISSPFLRCAQTLEVLAEKMDLPIEPNEALSEDADFEEVLKLLLTVPDGTVLCSHGGVIPDTLGALERRGCKIVGKPDWRKGTVWVLERSDDINKIVDRATVWPPPE